MPDAIAHHIRLLAVLLAVAALAGVLCTRRAAIMVQSVCESIACSQARAVGLSWSEHQGACRAAMRLAPTRTVQTPDLQVCCCGHLLPQEPPGSTRRRGTLGCGEQVRKEHITPAHSCTDSCQGSWRRHCHACRLFESATTGWWQHMLTCQTGLAAGCRPLTVAGAGVQVLAPVGAHHHSCKRSRQGGGRR